MEINKLKRIKLIGISIVSIVILLLALFSTVAGYQTTQSTNQNKTNSVNKGKTLITVDDEPGDADFTSIKEAVNSSSPGDIIEVYSGTYHEQGIHIINDSISLLGISHELGEGDDSGKPFIKGNGTTKVIWVEASHVVVSNFTIENPNVPSYDFTCGVYIYKRFPPFKQDDIIISHCIIRNTPFGIYVSYKPENLSIIHNQISQCNHTGITMYTHGFIITENVITDCGEKGIYIHYSGDPNNISGNKIGRCKVGIGLSGNNNIVYGNDIDSCAVGIQYGNGGNIITKNNFKNYSRIGFWFGGTVGERFIEDWKRSRCIGNYWDTWNGVGPKIIPGFKVLWIRLTYYIVIPVFLPWIDIDWKPAQEPYDI